MQNQFYNQPMVDWAKENLQNSVKIELRFNSLVGKILTLLGLFIVPLIFFTLAAVIEIQRFRGEYHDDAHGGTLVLCGFVMAIPFGIIGLYAYLLRGKFAKSLSADGVKTNIATFDWGKLYYVDHVSKIIERGNLSNKRIKDNQLELVFETGKVIIPPLIQNREQIWNLINSAPAEVRDDGEIRKTL